MSTAMRAPTEIQAGDHVRIDKRMCVVRDLVSIAGGLGRILILANGKRHRLEAGQRLLAVRRAPCQ